MTSAEAKQVKHLALQYAGACELCTAARGRGWQIRSQRIARRKEAKQKLLNYLAFITREQA